MQMDAQKVLIIGSGTVGFATGNRLAKDGHIVTFYDNNPVVLEKLSKMGYLVANEPRDIPNFDVALISVQTNIDENGKYLLDSLRDSLNLTLSLAKKHQRTVHVGIRSTTFPGTISLLKNELKQIDNSFENFIRLAATPELLRQKSAESDFAHSPIKYAGAEDEETREYFKKLFEKYCDQFITFQNFEKAEMTKIAHNLANSAEILFWNQLALIADHFTIPIDEVKSIVTVTAESRTNKNYAWGNKNPLGGACLPKDLRGVTNQCKSLEINVSSLEGMIALDDYFR